MPATPSLDLRLLGSFRVFVDGELLDDSSWSHRKSKSLLKILALERTHQLHREQLMELLWPEMDGESALNNLHKAIHAARRALEPSLDSGAASRFLQTQNQLVILQDDGGLQIDADLFEDAASQAIDQSTVASLSAAAALYTGDLLEEDRYED